MPAVFISGVEFAIPRRRSANISAEVAGRINAAVQRIIRELSTKTK